MSKRKTTVNITSVTVPLFIPDTSSLTGGGLSGLLYNTSGLICEYRRQGASSWTAVSLVTATLGTWTSGGFVADGSRAGYYELGLPNAALASGARWVAVRLYGAANMPDVPLEIEIDAINYQDSVRAGLTALPNAAPATTNGLPTVSSGINLTNVAVSGIWNYDLTLGSDGSGLNFGATSVAATLGLSGTNYNNPGAAVPSWLISDPAGDLTDVTNNLAYQTKAKTDLIATNAGDSPAAKTAQTTIAGLVAAVWAYAARIVTGFSASAPPIQYVAVPVAPPGTFYYKAGETGPDIVYQPLNPDGTITNLAGCTAATLKMRTSDGQTSVTLTGAASVDTTNNILRYVWGAADLATAGEYDAEFTYTDAAGKKVKPPRGLRLKIRVSPAIS